jgi:hypothetical protein
MLSNPLAVLSLSRPAVLIPLTPLPLAVVPATVSLLALA